MGFGSKLKKAVKKVVNKVAEPIKKVAKTTLGLTGIPQLLDMVQGGEDGGGDVPVPIIDTGGMEKPITMPTADAKVVADARRRALLARQMAGGRRSTILADKTY